MRRSSTVILKNYIQKFLSFTVIEYKERVPVVNKMKRKVIGISLGDPAGIGPEVLLKGLPYIKKIPDAIPLVIGDVPVIEKNFIYGKTQLNVVKTKDEIKTNCLNIYEAGIIKNKKFPTGKNSSLCGKASFLYVERAIQLWKECQIDGLLTLPISKKSWHLAGFRYTGHTELLAQRLGCKKYAMVMIAGNIRALLVTTHIPLKDVSKNLSVPLLVEKVTTGCEFLIKLGIKRPVIAISALNPHSGEAGVFGREEKEIIIPAIRILQKRRIDCEGPIPADAIFKKAVKGNIDMVIVMYHDQAMIPLKTFFFEKLVNCTAGLKMVRTSPGHGTAFDIAYKGKADPSSFVEAYKLAVRLTE
ncbi:MAG: 4-hydroxythreonine-4-phosphate dehydrogenase PdxA [Candidatus Omnitrophica bacterium]|nr:4-hydroxythreonine-4-phosphate dehydrogenase PdxA [Candidatus Omnitrophota bacterium]